MMSRPMQNVSFTEPTKEELAQTMEYWEGNSIPANKQRSFVAGEMLKKAELYEQRNALYGDNYKRFGDVMLHLFPAGVALNGAHDFNRFGVFVQLVAKVTRYAAQFAKGGHEDSLDDITVYAMMLKELDDIAKHDPKGART